jgi:hypothetical protein
LSNWEKSQVCSAPSSRNQVVPFPFDSPESKLADPGGGGLLPPPQNRSTPKYLESGAGISLRHKNHCRVLTVRRKGSPSRMALSQFRSDSSTYRRHGLGLCSPQGTNQTPVSSSSLRFQPRSRCCRKYALTRCHSCVSPFPSRSLSAVESRVFWYNW